MTMPTHARRMARPSSSPPRSTRRAVRAVLATTVTATATMLGGAALVPATAAPQPVVTAAFSGTTGTATSGGVLYAKANAPLTLTVNAPADTQCITGVPAGFTGATFATSGKSLWTFSGSAQTGDDTRTFTIGASGANKQGNCTGQSGTATPSYVSDNTGPIVTAALNPAANAAGWNNTNTTVTWSATDAGAGMGTGPSPASSSETSNGIVTRTSTATDAVGNSGSGSVLVRVDKAAPTITGAQVKNPDGSVTVTFTCDDGNSGGQPSGIATCLADGSGTNAVTVRSSGNVTGTATDKAGNTASTTVAVQAGDTTPPTLSGAPTTAPNAAGWYRGDVTVHWTAADPESGIPTAPADTTINGEGSGLTSSTTVRNGAGLTTTATSTPPVNVDRTAPTTSLTGGSNAWTNGDVTLQLAASDNRSGVASTQYAVDGGPMQNGSTVMLSSEGEHTVTYRSTDVAGNVEGLTSTTVRIDKTAPTIRHTFDPDTYADAAWTNRDVTVTFVCTDQGGSGTAGCTGPVTRSTQGEYVLEGTATDGAGNTATDHASVRIDKTDPTLTAAVSGTRNAAGWYKDDVTVTWTAQDDLSGVVGSVTADVLGEGAGQSLTRSVSDRAGNTAAATVGEINVDKTPPVLTADAPTGWHTGDVTVSWTCTDALSHVATAPKDSPVSGEGDNLTATASCTDVAGNTTTTTIDGIKIDRNAPTTTARVADANAAGWYDAPVTVTLSGSDNLDPAVTTYYRIDEGDAQRYERPFSVGEGQHAVSYWSEDAAGNAEEPGAPLALRVDRTAPTTTVVNPISPDSGWFVTSGVPVEFAAADEGSGIAGTYFQVDGGKTQKYGDPFTADLSDGTHTISYWSVDLAGNEEAHETTNTVRVKVDTIAPTITPKRTPAANSFGWNNTDVKVAFSCSDADSGIDGIAGCGPDQTVSSEGENQSVQGDTQDVAGNKGSVTVDKISIDKTAPSLTGTTTGDSNGGEWYRGDVSIAWSGVDGLSGIDTTTQPSDSTISGEGRNLGASASIFDKAGNKGTGSVSGIKIDRTPLDITAKLPAGKNAAGWYHGDVTVDFSCSDPALADGSAGSGMGTCPTEAVVSGDGANQSVTSATAVDVAGNTSTKTVNGINIDGHEPQTKADNQCTATNGYCTGSTATVVLDATDVGPSGVKEIHYTVNGGTEQVAAGSSTSVSVPLSGTGTATVKYYAVDVAGNVEPTSTARLNYDNIAPTVTHTVNPRANASDWNNTDVTVHFDATDTDPGSGIAAGSVTPDQVVSIETSTSGVVVNGSAKDTAGNTGTDSVTVKLDKTKPTIGGSVVSGTLGKNGWYVSPVKVHFTCNDALSGVASCQDDVTLSDNGASQSASGSAKDVADNVGTASVSGISIDNENPTITNVNVTNGFYTLGGAPTASCTATDSFSGVDTCKVTVTGGTASGVGTFSWTATATDRAGNHVSQSGTYKVVYGFDGFLQPINDTAHQVGTTTSVFKAGSTIPVKFQLKNTAGNPVQAATAPVWLTPVKGGPMSLPVDETVQTVSADSGSSFRYDATAQQYIYNWKSPSTGGSYYQIGVRLDDGQTYYVNIGLR